MRIEAELRRVVNKETTPTERYHATDTERGAAPDATRRDSRALPLGSLASERRTIERIIERTQSFRIIRSPMPWYRIRHSAVKLRYLSTHSAAQYKTPPRGASRNRTYNFRYTIVRSAFARTYYRTHRTRAFPMGVPSHERHCQGNHGRSRTEGTEPKPSSTAPQGFR